MANRLANATSPYLLQHAENPVDWWEWGPEAFAEAKRRGVPVLLSVGYAACHWCHVMAHESFEDDATAAYLNEHYVSIKVDREERPDVDAVYMEATTAMTGHGGWPMTVVLDHEGGPFFAGTYFPDRPRHGQPSFRQVLEAVTEAWTQRGEEVQRVATQLREHLNRAAPSATGDFDREVVEAALDGLERDFDQTAGGFGSSPKFPPSMVLEFLLRVSTGPDDRAARMLDATLDAMARGGIYDQLGGGFARYAVDRGWVVPHFEKMLYDNAQLMALYARRDDPLLRRVAGETADFVVTELGTAEGGFASALDADSEGEEGRFYVWTPAQLVEVLGADDGTWAARLLSVTDAGTFEQGASTLQLRADPEGPADAERWAGVRHRLHEARKARVRPARDDKVVAAWNGLAITGLCEVAVRQDRPDLLESAVRAGELLARVHLDGGRLLRVSRDGVAGPHAGVLEDHGCVASGFLSLAQATADARWLTLAGEVLDAALDHFRADDGGFHDTADDAEALVSRPRDPSDNASPSGLSSAIHALTAYAALTGSSLHREAAEAALSTAAALAAHAPRFTGWSLAAAVALLDGPREIAVVGPAGDAREALAGAARRDPSAVVVVAEESPGVHPIPLLTGRVSVEGRPAAYVCRHHVCARPVTDPAALS
ncbi:thioredoxin domain-containing protein [Nocardioides bigeumensis]|uniref:Thioredoxin domain-containing protein n=1 Tax=Nocardioides bigeumensis TaxID=433657 RepID=A0ABP5KE94_9ACTN